MPKVGPFLLHISKRAVVFMPARKKTANDIYHRSRTKCRNKVLDALVIRKTCHGNAVTFSRRIPGRYFRSSIASVLLSPDSYGFPKDKIDRGGPPPRCRRAFATRVPFIDYADCTVTDHRDGPRFLRDTRARSRHPFYHGGNGTCCAAVMLILDAASPSPSLPPPSPTGDLVPD